MTMTLTTIQTETTQDDRAKCDLFALATNAGNVTPYSNVFLVQDSPLNNSMNFGFGTRMQTPQLPASIVPVPTFAPTVIPVRPVPNVIQPSLVDQFPAAHQITSNIIQPVAIPSIPIQLQAETMHQNLLLLQQQRQLLQQQHAQQEVQQQLQQQLQQELQQVQTQFQHQQAEQRILPHQQVQQTQYQQQLLPVVTIPQHISATPQPIIHNLIPKHLQDASLQTNSTIENNNFVSAVNMLLTAATATNNSAAVAATSQIKSSLIPQQIQQQQQQPPAVSIPLTVQDRTSTVPPVFNGVNMAYPGLETLGVDPPIFLVRDFLTHAECDFLIRAADGVWQPAPVVGKGAGEISPSRTSSTCFLAREDLPDYLRKVSALTCKPIDHCELPQVGRYLPTQQYRHHFDAFDLSNEDGRRFAQNGGQRVVTVLVYLNDCARGGQTEFPSMNIQVSPRKGSAVVFFPATIDGYLDKRALHAALPAIDTKYVSQVWIRQSTYTGFPSKRLAQPMVNILY